MSDPAATGEVELVPAPKVKAYLEEEFGIVKAMQLVAELGTELERWLAPGGPASVSTVADIPTKKILTGIDYRGIAFEGRRIEPSVAIVAPYRSAGHFLITGIEPLSSLHADGVEFGDAVRASRLA